MSKMLLRAVYAVQPVYYGHIETIHKCTDYQGVPDNPGQFYKYMLKHTLGVYLSGYILGYVVRRLVIIIIIIIIIGAVLLPNIEALYINSLSPVIAEENAQQPRLFLCMFLFTKI